MLKLTRKREHTLLIASVAILFLLVFLSPQTYASHRPTISTIGGPVVKINQYEAITLRFAPDHPIFVKSGSTIVLTEASNDGHTFTVVDKSLLPQTTNDVLSCGTGAPGSDICSTVLAAHGALAPPPSTIPTPQPYCQTVPNPPFGDIAQCTDAGAQVPSGGAFPNIDTAYTLTSGGDSIILLPGQSIVLTISAPAGTVLHFMCVFHPWMQGEIVVTNGSESGD